MKLGRDAPSVKFYKNCSKNLIPTITLDLYQVCSYGAPGVKTGPAPGGHKSESRGKKGKLQNSSSPKLEGVAFDI